MALMVSLYWTSTSIIHKHHAIIFLLKSLCCFLQHSTILNVSRGGDDEPMWEIHSKYSNKNTYIHTCAYITFCVFCGTGISRNSFISCYRLWERLYLRHGMSDYITKTVSLEMARHFCSISYRSLKDTHGLLSQLKTGMLPHFSCSRIHRE